MFFPIPGIEDRFAEMERLVSQLRRRGSRRQSSSVYHPAGESGRSKSCFTPGTSTGIRLPTARTARTLHFADHPELADFDFPDGIHLDVSDQKAFTRTLDSPALSSQRYRGQTPGSDPGVRARGLTPLGVGSRIFGVSLQQAAVPGNVFQNPQRTVRAFYDAADVVLP